MVQISCKDSTLFQSMLSERVIRIQLSLLPLSKDEGVKDSEHSMSIKNLILGVSSVTVSYCSHREGEGVLEKENKGKQ